MPGRREFLRRLSLAAGAVVLVPSVSRVGVSQHASELVTPPLPPTGAPTPSLPDAAALAERAIVRTESEGWDAVAYNKARGNAGAIPDSYLPSINGPDGDWDHIGKHLPFVPAVESGMVPEGMLAIMWGDPNRGHTRHPNARPSELNNHEGHWYDWIRVRKAVNDDAEELQSTYTSWPGIGEGSTGAYAVFGDGEITDDGGVKTIYLAALPSDVRSGDRVRIYAHCLTHGEYVDFLTVP